MDALGSQVTRLSDGRERWGPGHRVGEGTRHSESMRCSLRSSRLLLKRDGKQDLRETPTEGALGRSAERLGVRGAVPPRWGGRVATRRLTLFAHSTVWDGGGKEKRESRPREEAGGGFRRILWDTMGANGWEDVGHDDNDVR